VQLLNNPIELGGEERVATILFSNIRGFTTFCKGLPPKELLKTSNKALSITSDIVESRQRGVDKYNGDAVTALFGALINGDQDTVNAMTALLEITSVLESLMRLYNASNIGSEASMDDSPNLPIASSGSSALLVSRSGFISSNY